MKKKSRFLLLAVIITSLGVFIFWRNNSPSLITSRLLLSNPQAPSLLHYKIRLFGVLELGQAKIIFPKQEELGNASIYQIKGEGGPSKFIAMFFNPKASAISEIDLKRSLPVKFTYSMAVPGVPTDNKTITYDHKNNTMELDGVKRVIFANTQDPLSAMHFIRNQEMALGKEFDINFNTNQKNYRILLKVAEKKEFLVRGRKIVLWLLEGQIGRRDKSPRHRTYIKIWFWAEFKVPVLVKTMTNGGQFVISLEGMGK